MLNHIRTLFRQSQLQNQHGAFLYEALIAIAILGLGVAVISSLRGMMPDSAMSMRRACVSYAQTMVVAVQEEAYYREILNFVPTSTSNSSPYTGRRMGDVATSANWFSSDTRAIPTSLRVTNWTPVALGAGDHFVVSRSVPANPIEGTVLHSSQLIQGTIRTLTSIYNNNPALRCAMSTYAPLTSKTNIAPSPEFDRRLPVALIRISPYNRETGLAISCPNNLFIAPEGELLTNLNFSAFAPGSGANPVPAANQAFVVGAGLPAEPVLNPATQIANRGFGAGAELSNIGLNLDVHVTYRQENGAPGEECYYTQKFEYPRDRTPPGVSPAGLAPPQVTLNLTNVPVGTCNPTVPLTNLNVEILTNVAAPAELEHGVQFLCRDLSWKKGWAPNPPVANVFTYPVCFRAGVRDMTTNVRNPAAGPYFVNYDPPLQSFASRVNRWVPCDQLSQCGLVAASANVQFNGGALTNPNAQPITSQKMTLNYPAVPVGCVLNFEVVSVDTAGNTSVAGSVGNRRFLEDAAAGVKPMNEVKYGDCGVYNPSDVTFGGYRYKQGYYKCP